jgi:hypothetical protein
MLLLPSKFHLLAFWANVMKPNPGTVAKHAVTGQAKILGPQAA